VTAMTYSKYLHLNELLSLQHPLTPSDQQDLRDSEQFFIVVHQASETLLSQALIDLRHVEANHCSKQCFAQRMERASKLVDALEGQLTLLHQALRPEDFLGFRHRFGTASGMQSTQFHELIDLTERLMTRDVSHGGPEEPRQLVRLSTAVQRWRYTHLKLVQHMIGDLPGSANSSGVRYLASKLNCPSPPYSHGRVS
jgi:tryptophan 2,3-dioxygenase